jgi:DNA polymerase elongation subunit (family B)
MLKDGQTKQEDLVIGKRISQEPNTYKVDSLTALAAQQLEDFGIPIHPGEKVRYMIKDALSKDKDERVRPFPLVGPDDTYDVKKYLEMLTKATEEILIHLGYDAKRLQAIVDSHSQGTERLPTVGRHTVNGDCPRFTMDHKR